MRLVPCPDCGPREPGEFVCLGDSGGHPVGEDGLAEALYGRANAKGPVEELWWHKFGCRRWLKLRRNSATNEFVP
ncbi:MAG: sarcosine oxidase subunit delta [Alphaproteobacteria bacterium]|nr:sarcosine oxidase subunit delta [Alphaproteobacteria bacterium]